MTTAERTDPGQRIHCLGSQSAHRKRKILLANSRLRPTCGSKHVEVIWFLPGRALVQSRHTHGCQAGPCDCRELGELLVTSRAHLDCLPVAAFLHSRFKPLAHWSNQDLYSGEERCRHSRDRSLNNVRGLGATGGRRCTVCHIALIVSHPVATATSVSYRAAPSENVAAQCRYMNRNSRQDSGQAPCRITGWRALPERLPRGDLR